MPRGEALHDRSAGAAMGKDAPPEHFLVNTPLRRRGAPRPESEGDKEGSECGCRHESGLALLEHTGVCTAFSGERLYSWDECPAVLRYNKYIRSGYRAGMSYRQCARSVFQYHNETGNIWTHLAPLLAVVASLALGWLRPWPLAHAQFVQNVLPIAGLAHAFTTAYYAVGVVAIVAALRAHSAWARGLPMLGLFVMRLANFATRAVLRSGSQAALLHFATMEVLAVVGGVINASRFPERWFPPADEGAAGRFDYWLNSHQLMHVLVLWSMVHMHLGSYEDYKYAIATNGECRPWAG